MNTYPELLVYAAHYDPKEPEIIDKVKAIYHYHPEDRVNTTRELTKYQLIEKIQKGANIKTGIKIDGSYKVDHEIYVVTIYGMPYIKVHKDPETKDDLGKLESY